MSIYDMLNQALGIPNYFPPEESMLNMPEQQPMDQVLGVPADTQIDTRQRRPLQGVQTDGTRIKDIPSSAQAKTDAFSARAKGIGAKARIMDSNRRNALGLSSQENRRRTQ